MLIIHEFLSLLNYSNLFQPQFIYYLCFMNSDSLSHNNTEAILAAHGIRPTTNRILVIRALTDSRGPMSLMQLEGEIDTLDKSSISRTLSLLLSKGIVHVLEDGRGIAHYELCANHNEHDSDDDIHPHFYCERCQRVYCLDNATIPPVEVPDDFEVSRVNFMLTGICAKCAVSNH